MNDGLKRLVEWTRGLGKCAPQSSGEAQRVITVILRKAEQILAEEKAEKPTAPASLVDKIYDLAQSRNGDGCDPIWPSELLEVISCYRPVEAKARAYLNGLPDKGGN